MERLLYSSSPTAPLKLHCKPTTSSLPRLPRIDAAKLGGFPLLPRPPLQRRRASTISCKYETNPPSVASVSSGKLPSLAPLQVDSCGGSAPSSDLVEQIPTESSHYPRKAVSVVACVLLSAILMFTMHPIFAAPALATYQTAAKATAPVGLGAKLIRTELLSSAWTGFFAGCLHTLSGPDHLAALAPLSIGRTRLESAAVGALWGCGHDAGQVIFGLLFLLLKDRLHIEILRTWGTRVVGLTLLVIGGMGIKEASEVPAPCVALENGECDVSVYESLEAAPAVAQKKKIGFATFATGIVHGLQPDALMMVLPALALPSRVAGAAFLVMFLVGTVVAMGCYTVFIGSCSEALKDRVPRITEKLTWASSFIAIALGVSILVSQFFGFSLY
ncbi:unnamed protein product [Linum trigynum]|uniref:Urease accessory protein UreH-like transmembrane domain-containing protein n=1 Tax=Linum trigynum TaxID=586398 RepID=A0AAV2GHN5_9ROSI